MEAIIKREIELKAKKILKKRNARTKKIKKSRYLFETRTGCTPTPSQAQSEQKPLHPHFDPKYCIKYSKRIAKTIWWKLNEGTYKPIPALKYRNDNDREIMQFTIPDTIVATIFNKKLTKRNLNRFSSNSYAYRPDQGTLDAVFSLTQTLQGENIFVVKSDFKKYFDSIHHLYLKETINKKIFRISEMEKRIIDAFLSHEYADRDKYQQNKFCKREKGVPQGSSISLFLSNIASHELDKNLEKHSGQFVRYADDVISISYTYEDALGVNEIFLHHSQRSGVEINHKKSKGIFLLSSQKREIRYYKNFAYLGYSFYINPHRSASVALTQEKQKRIKEAISKKIYLHLIRALQHPKSPGFNTNRINNPQHYDWDLVTCLNEIRKYIYGNLRHKEIDKFLKEKGPIQKMQGLMSFYPLIENLEQFKKLDGWLLNAIHKAHILRRKLILDKYSCTMRPLSKNDLLNNSWHSSPPQYQNETSFPSFVFAWRAARKYYFMYGLKGFEQPKYYSYDK